MSKKQAKKPQTSNKTNNVAIDIDYDKLAEAIVRAQNAATIEQRKLVKKRTRFRNVLLGFLNGSLYHGIAIYCILFIIHVWKLYIYENSYSLTDLIVFTLLFAIAGAMSFLCGQETLDDDYDTTVPLFNLNVSLIAMVVALISFFHVVN